MALDSRGIVAFLQEWDQNSDFLSLYSETFFFLVTIGTVRVGDSCMIHDTIQNEIHDPESPLNQA